jgi:multicomponent Na+:H+ antiporter subunit F
MNVFEIVLEVSFILVMLGVALAFVRLILGPTLPDRIVAFDMMTVLIVSFCGLYTIRTNDTSFIDVAIVLALISFLTTVALARYVERRSGHHVRDQPQGHTPFCAVEDKKND